MPSARAAPRGPKVNVDDFACEQGGERGLFAIGKRYGVVYVLIARLQCQGLQRTLDAGMIRVLTVFLAVRLLIGTNEEGGERVCLALGDCQPILHVTQTIHTGMRIQPFCRCQVLFFNKFPIRLFGLPIGCDEGIIAVGRMIFGKKLFLLLRG